jgi:hypothetical protein
MRRGVFGDSEGQVSASAAKGATPSGKVPALTFRSRITTG